MNSAALVTIGCRFNQVESNDIGEALAAAGFELRSSDEAADVYIINSCTVTAQADRRCAQILRQLRRQYPEATLVVTGCFAETQPAVVAALPEADLVVRNTEKDVIVDRVCRALGVESSPRSDLVGRRRTSRAFLAIQRGCDCRCAYCIVPAARGPSRSQPLERVLARLSRLAGEGYAEVVLTGINLGRYGRDLDDSPRLADVLRGAEALGPRFRVRLSSLEPAEVDEALLEALSLEHVCPHVHLPVQSASDLVLRRMGRKYDGKQLRELVERLAGLRRAMALGADVMVGFPGEAETDFQATLGLLSDLPFAYFHVFQYSPRPGTRAAEMSDSVPAAVKGERAAQVRELGQAKWEAFQRRHVGCVLESIVARKRDPRTHRRLAIAGNYLRPYVVDRPELVDQLAPVRVTGLAEGRLLGEVLGSDRASRCES